jgi:hypothetical protein
MSDLIPMRHLTFALFAISLLSCKAKKEIPTFRIVDPNETATNETTVTTPAPQSKQPRPLRWVAPETWEEQTPGQFQIALYRIAPNVTAAVSQFPGDAGGMLANVNRWREQVGLPPANEIGGDTIALEDGKSEARWFEFKGVERTILAAIIPVDGVTWFFKLDSSTVALETARPGFMDLLKSIEIGSSAATTMPIIDLQTPDGWLKRDGDKLRFASYAIADSSPYGIEGDVSVIPLPGDGGTTLANVNLWRTQLRLAPLEKEDDPALGETSSHPNGTITIIHMKSTEPLFSNDRYGAISAAILRTGKVTWFFKIAGEANMISAQRAKFVDFVRSATVK